MPGTACSSGLQLIHPWARLSPPYTMAVPRGSVCRDGQDTAHEQLMRGKRCEKQPFEAQDGGGEEEVFHVPEQIPAVPGEARLEQGNSKRQEWGEDVSWVDPKPLFPIPMYQSGWGGRGIGDDRA